MLNNSSLSIYSGEQNPQNLKIYILLMDLWSNNLEEWLKGNTLCFSLDSASVTTDLVFGIVEEKEPTDVDMGTKIYSRSDLPAIENKMPEFHYV